MPRPSLRVTTLALASAILPVAAAPTASLAASAPAGPESPAGQDTYIWVGGMGPFWSEEANWEVNGRTPEDPPGCGDATNVAVIVNLAGGEIISVRCQPTTVIDIGTLTSSGGTLRAQDRLLVRGGATVSNLWLIDLLSTLETDGDFILTGDDSRWERGPIEGAGTLVNAGTLNTGPLTRLLRTEFRNDGTFVNDGTTTIAGSGGAQTVIENNGLLRGGGQINDQGLDDSIVNTGTIRADDGTFTIGTPIFHDGGSLEAAAGSTLRVQQGLYVFATAGMAPDDGGVVLLQPSPGADPYFVDGTLTLTGAGTVDVRTTVELTQSGRIDANSSQSGTSGLLLTGGAIEGDGTVSVGGLMTMPNGSVGGSVFLVVEPGGRLVTTPQQTRSIEGSAVLLMGGTMIQEGTTAITTANGGNVSGTLEFRSGSITGGGGLVIEGTVVRPADVTSGLPTFQTPLILVPGGTVRNETGVFRVTGDTTFAGGTLEALPGAELRLQGPMVATEFPKGDPGGPTMLTGGGFIDVRSGVEIQTDRELVATMAEPDGTLALSTGTMSGDGTLRNEGYLVWQGTRLEIGTANGGDDGGDFVGGLVNTGTVLVTGGNLRLDGILAHDGGEFFIEQAILIEDDGRLEVRSGAIDLIDGNLADGGSGGEAAVILRPGAILRKDAFENTEPSDVRTRLVAEDGARIEARASTLEIEGELQVSGTVVCEVDGGTLLLNGGATEPMLGGTVRIEGNAGTCIIGGSSTWLGVDLDVQREVQFNSSTISGGSLVTVSEGAVALWRSTNLVGFGTDLEIRDDSVVVYEAGANRSIGGTLLNDGIVSHVGGILTLGEDGRIENFSGGVFGDGGYELRGGATISGSFDAPAPFQNFGVVRKLGEGTATIATRFRNNLGGGNGSVVVTSGTLQITGPIDGFADGLLENGAWIVEEDGRLLVPGPITTIGGSAFVECRRPVADGFPALTSLVLNRGILTLSGPLDQPITNQGIVRLSGDDLAVPGSIINEESDIPSVIGEIEGVIALADGGAVVPRFITPLVTNAGRITPGGAAAFGTVAITGDLVQAPAGIITIDADGPVADVLDVDGDVTLDGTLELTWLNAEPPTVGTEITVLTATGTIGGVFDDVVGPGGWDVTVAGGAVTATLVTPPTCDADIDGDALVGLNDLLAVLAAWGMCPACPADLDDDGIVGLNDLLSVLAAWGPCG